MLKQTIIMGLIAGLSVTMTDVEAKRVGGGKTSGVSRPAAAKPAKKAADEPDTGSSVSSTSIRPRVTVNSNSPASQPGSAAVPAAAAGAHRS